MTRGRHAVGFQPAAAPPTTEGPAIPTIGHALTPPQELSRARHVEAAMHRSQSLASTASLSG
jgi:hypothetical protein